LKREIAMHTCSDAPKSDWALHRVGYIIEAFEAGWVSVVLTDQIDSESQIRDIVGNSELALIKGVK
jgi:hypothetical protein